MSRLPKGIKKIELGSRKDGRPEVRYVVTVDVGTTNSRKQKQRRFKTEAEARKWQSETQTEVRRGTYVATNKLTVEQACADWLASKHNIKASTRRGYEVWLKPLREELGAIELQKLSKSDLDKLVGRLRTGDVPEHGKWTARSVNGLLWAIQNILEGQRKQGNLVRNVAELVDRLPSEKAEMKTLSETDIFRVLDYPDRDRHLWWLVLAMGLRRGEVAGLRRKFVDFEKQTIEIVETRVCVGKEIVTETPKSQRSRRELPIPDELMPILQDAFGRTESEWVACGKDGEPYHPNYITERWGKVLEQLGIEFVRLHDGRHSYASYLHYKGVPIATISKALGHATAAFTMATYVHSQDEALKEASKVFGRNNG